MTTNIRNIPSWLYKLAGIALGLPVCRLLWKVLTGNGISRIRSTRRSRRGGTLAVPQQTMRLTPREGSNRLAQYRATDNVMQKQLRQQQWTIVYLTSVLPGQVHVDTLSSIWSTTTMCTTSAMPGQAYIELALIWTIWPELSEWLYPHAAQGISNSPLLIHALRGTGQRT